MNNIMIQRLKSIKKGQQIVYHIGHLATEIYFGSLYDPKIKLLKELREFTFSLNCKQKINLVQRKVNGGMYYGQIHKFAYIAQGL